MEVNVSVADGNPLPVRQVDDSDKEVAIAALVVAAVAFITAVVQLAQAVIATAKGLPNCDKRVMGQWATLTYPRFRWRQLRLEVSFDAPVIFLAAQNNVKGPVHDPPTPIYYANGSDDSCRDFRIVPLPSPDHQGSPDPAAAAAADAESRTSVSSRVEAGVGGGGKPTARRERVQTTDNELATWVRLLGAVQKMERDSNKWDEERWAADGAARPAGLVLSLAVGVQAKRRSFDSNPSSMRKPYATTTLCHMVELAAVLGLYWKEFDRAGNKYRAEGNGYSLLGTRYDDFGLVFAFETFGWARFGRTRVVPTSEVKELCFGNAPTFYRPREKDEECKLPIGEQEKLETLQLGSPKEIAETLGLIGCNTTTSLYYLRGKKHIHLFPVTFEILGMLGRTLHVAGRCFTYLPNPTIFQWNRRAFSLRRLLAEFHRHIREDRINDFALTDVLKTLDAALPPLRGAGYPPHALALLHAALDRCDAELGADGPDGKPREIVFDVLRRHLQEVLLAINTPAKKAAGRTPTTPTLATPVAPAAVPPSPTTAAAAAIAAAAVVHEPISFDDLLGVPPEYREQAFMDKYFAKIRPRVTSTDAADHHDPRAAEASKTIHRRQEEQDEEAQGEGAGGARAEMNGALPAAHAPAAASSSSSTAAAGPPDPRAGVIRPARRVGTWGSRDEQRNNIWCTLVFRMLVWLLLHDFDKNDVQISKSELMGSRLPVYIV